MSQPWTHVSPHSPAYPRINEHYVEPEWVSRRLFEVEKFQGWIHDPACGFGRIVTAAIAAGYPATGGDIVDRGQRKVEDFTSVFRPFDNLIFNPPFNIAQDFIEHAVGLADYKVAAIFPTARLNAARWLEALPLARIWLLTPRPSMPPGHVITNGGKVGGGKSDYCWLVFDGFRLQPAKIGWLHRDGTV